MNDEALYNLVAIEAPDGVMFAINPAHVCAICPSATGVKIVLVNESVTLSTKADQVEGLYQRLLSILRRPA